MIRLVLLLFLITLPAQALELAPFKDNLFAYPKTLERSKDGSYTLVDYQKQRDIFERDAVPRRKAKFKYIDQGVRWSRRVSSYKSPNGKFKYFRVGKVKGAKVTVIWVHGRGGNHRQGANDFTFGGNFNRLQNLMVKAGGVLLTPAFSDFQAKGAQDVGWLMRQFKATSPRTKMVLACGSMGGDICWRLAQNAQASAMIDGMFLLGSHWNEDFLASATAKSKRIPIFFGHGTKDVVFNYKTQRNFFEHLRKRHKNYPTRFVMFNTGVHGTPIRMVDWRRELNWMLK